MAEICTGAHSMCFAMRHRASGPLLLLAARGSVSSHSICAKCTAICPAALCWYRISSAKRAALEARTHNLRGLGSGFVASCSLIHARCTVNTIEQSSSHGIQGLHVAACHCRRKASQRESAARWPLMKRLVSGVGGTATSVSMMILRCLSLKPEQLMW